MWVLWVCGCAGIDFANNGAASRANACARPATMMTRSGRGARSEPVSFYRYRLFSPEDLR